MPVLRSSTAEGGQNAERASSKSRITHHVHPPQCCYGGRASRITHHASRFTLYSPSSLTRKASLLRPLRRLVPHHLLGPEGGLGRGLVRDNFSRCPHRKRRRCLRRIPGQTLLAHQPLAHLSAPRPLGILARHRGGSGAGPTDRGRLARAAPVPLW